MIDQNTPQRFIATCVYCAAMIDIRDPQHYQRMKGWALNRNRGNSVTLGVRVVGQWACHECIHKLQNHIPTGQMSLLGLGEDD